MTNARSAVIATTHARDKAADAAALAEASLALAKQHAQDMQARLDSIAQIEHDAAHSFAARIRAAAASGGAVKTTKPSADAIARHGVEADLRSAKTAVDLLTHELVEAMAALDAAKLDLQLATLEACNEAAVAIVARMDEAYQVLRHGRAHLACLGNAAFTPMPQPDTPLAPGAMSVPPKVLQIGERGRFLLNLVPPPVDRTKEMDRTLTDDWRGWRHGLSVDPDVASPWERDA